MSEHRSNHSQNDQNEELALAQDGDDLRLNLDQEDGPKYHYKFIERYRSWTNILARARRSYYIKAFSKMSTGTVRIGIRTAVGLSKVVEVWVDF